MNAVNELHKEAGENKIKIFLWINSICASPTVFISTG
jgi:hypothetical protein